jgi:hypothetical protein
MWKVLAIAALGVADCSSTDQTKCWSYDADSQRDCDAAGVPLAP